jgi:hypothetical protein
MRGVRGAACAAFDVLRVPELYREERECSARSICLMLTYKEIGGRCVPKEPTCPCNFAEDELSVLPRGPAVFWSMPAGYHPGAVLQVSYLLLRGAQGVPQHLLIVHGLLERADALLQTLCMS